MISWVENRKGLNFAGKPTVKVLKRGDQPFPVEARFGSHGTVHLDREAAEALMAALQTALGGSK